MTVVNSIERLDPFSDYPQQPPPTSDALQARPEAPPSYTHTHTHV
jgi:hypothetical protein